MPDSRMNDAAVDRAGRIWAGTMDDREQAATGCLYRLDTAGNWSKHDTGYIVSNGPTFSPGHDVLYHTDTTRRVIYRFPLARDGSLGKREVFVTFPEDWGWPDGMATDVEGGIWVAHWGGARVSRFLPDGRLDRAIAMPVSQVTSCCFAGPRARSDVRDQRRDRSRRRTFGGRLVRGRRRACGVRRPTPTADDGPQSRLFAERRDVCAIARRFGGRKGLRHGLRHVAGRRPLGAALQRDREIGGAQRAHVVPERRVKDAPLAVLRAP